MSLKPVSLLSLLLQSEGAGIVLSMVNTMKSVKTLKKLTQQEVTEWPMVKLQVEGSRRKSEVSMSGHSKFL